MNLRNPRDRAALIIGDLRFDRFEYEYEIECEYRVSNRERIL